MPQHVLTQQAESDLDEIWDYVAEDSTDNAGSLIDRITERFVILAEQPLIGCSRSELAPDLRSFPVGNYIIIYRPTDYGVEVARVLHGSRDIEAMFS